VRRNRSIALLLVIVLVALGVWLTSGGGGTPVAHATHHPVVHPRKPSHSRLDSDWEGDGKPVTMAFGGDVNFPSGSVLGERLGADPASALGPGVPALLAGAGLTMVNFESAMTDGTCPDPQPKTYDFYAPATALTAFRSAGVDLVSEANNHGEDCGAAGLQMALAARDQNRFTVLGIGQNAQQAFTPFQTVIDGQRIGIIAATQVIDADLQQSWTATATQPGLASAYDVTDLVAAVEAARKVDDTVIVFLHWGVELQTCPDPLQEPLANVLVKAGADIVIGSHAHVLLGGGYLGSAYVDYGLGNFAFYNTPAPTDQSGSLIITATGRRIDAVTWRPALIEDELPVPLSGADATQALQSWNAARGCTDLTPTQSASLATPASETAPVSPAVAQPLTVDS
jgi:poly-gamma-glutamate synthesis protein (capsule biosynthesis protein)